MSKYLPMWLTAECLYYISASNKRPLSLKNESMRVPLTVCIAEAFRQYQIQK